MATIVNARDIILQAASPRILPVSLPSNITSIPSTVTVTGYGTLGGIANDSANALSQVSNKLNKASSDVLSGAISVTTSGGFKAGTIAWDSAGTVTGGSGVAMTAKGIVGASSGTPTFSIDINGNAYYYGTVSASQITTGSITAATVDTSSYMRAYGSSPTIVNLGYNSFYPTVFGDSTRTAGVGVLGNASGGPGVLGRTTNSGNSGVVGWGLAADANGVYGQSNSSTGAGVRAVNNDNGPALVVTGKMTISNSTLVTNLNADMLDGSHASAFATSGHTHSGYVSVASGRSSGDYVYVVDYSAPSNPTTRAGWVRVATNAGGGVWLPYYT